MAALEKLTKKELISLTRNLKQENKFLKKELEKIKNGELEENNFPLFAGTCYKAGDKHVVDVLKYSPESHNVKVVQKIEETTKELALYKLEMVIAEKMHQQELK